MQSCDGRTGTAPQRDGTNYTKWNARHHNWRTAATFFSKYGIYFAFVVLAGTLAVTSPPFRTLANAENILQQISVNGIIAIGMTMVIITGGIDLSVGSVLALSAVVATSFAHPGKHWLIVPVLMGVIVGLACGAVNGLLIAKKRLAPFIVTLGMMTCCLALALSPTVNQKFNLSYCATMKFAAAPSVYDLFPALIFSPPMLLGAFILHFTRFGRYVYAVGGNELAAKVSGVNTMIGC